jgi:hypothetical protein
VNFRDGYHMEIRRHLFLANNPAQDFWQIKDQGAVITAAELQSAVNAAASSQLLCTRPYVIWVPLMDVMSLAFR